MKNRIFLSNIGPKRTEREKFYEELAEAKGELDPLAGTNIGKWLSKRDKKEIGQAGGGKTRRIQEQK